MPKDRLRLDYEVNVDDDKVVDGIALAKELMADAMKNLAFYADGCSGCAHAMFGALAFMTAEEAEAATAKKGMASITWLLEGVTRDERKKRFKRHLARMKGKKDLLLEEARKRGADLGHH